MSDVYRIGVSLAMTSNGAQVLGALSRHLLGVHAQTNQLTAGFSRLKLAIGGALAIAGGVALASAFKGPLDEAKKFQTELAKFKQFGMSDDINAAAEKYVRATKIMGASTTDLMSIMVEAQGVFRESGETNAARALIGAEIATPILAKMRFATAALDGDKAASFAGQERDMLRFIESRGGANDPATFSKWAEFGWKMIQSSGHNIDWSHLKGVANAASIAGFSLTPEALAKLEPVITDLSGSTVGSGMRTAYIRLTGAQRGLPTQAVAEYLSLGLWDRSKVELSERGGVKRFLGRPGEVLKGADSLATDPVDYYINHFIPAIRKKYGEEILGDTVKARRERASEIGLVFGPGTAGKLYSQIDKQMPAIQRSIAAQAKALGIDASANNAAGTLAGREYALQKNWQTLMLQLGDKVLPLAIKGMTALNTVISKVSDWASQHPGQLDFMVKGVLAIGAALIGFGTIALAVAAGMAVFAAGPVAMIAAGVAGVASAISTLVALNWDAVKSRFRGLYDTLRFIVEHPVKFLTTPMSELPSAIGASARKRDIQEFLSHPHYKKGLDGNWVPDDKPRAPAVPHAQKQALVIDHKTILDGHVLAASVTRYQADEQDRMAHSGSANFDPSMTLSPVGMQGAA